MSRTPAGLFGRTTLPWNSSMPITRVTKARVAGRLDTLWVPSWGTPCGIAEYVGHLAEILPRVRISATVPPLAETRLLHLQHEYGLFRGQDMLELVEPVLASRVPLLVTEHTVRAQGDVWEEHVDVLISHTAAGAEVLRARCPGVPVYHIPHGCPTWFPPRKRERGRVLAAFGFLEPRKGFWKILDVLRALPGTSLVIYSHPLTDSRAKEWEQATEGLPVRWVRDFLPSEESARRIAAEADALVFWYKDIDVYSASGAVRVGLATGVPIVASSARWFDEMREAVYQPDDLVDGVRRILDDTTLRDHVVSGARAYCEENSWSRMGQRHRALWRSLAD